MYYNTVFILLLYRLKTNHVMELHHLHLFLALLAWLQTIIAAAVSAKADRIQLKYMES
jgi:hypothetical protein